MLHSWNTAIKMWGDWGTQTSFNKFLNVYKRNIGAINSSLDVWVQSSPEKWGWWCWFLWEYPTFPCQPLKNCWNLFVSNYSPVKNNEIHLKKKNQKANNKTMNLKWKGGRSQLVLLWIPGAALTSALHWQFVPAGTLKCLCSTQWSFWRKMENKSASWRWYSGFSPPFWKDFPPF